MRQYLLNCVWLFATPWAPLSMGFSRQEYWSGLPLSSPRDLPYPEIEPESLASLALAGGFFTSFSSVQFSCSVVSDSLRPYELQHARPPCLSPTPRVFSNSCPSSRWCHSAISSSVVPFSSCPQSLPASGSFPVSQLFASGGESIQVSASASVLPMNTQDWSPLGWTGWISLQSKGLARVFSNTTVQKHPFFGAQLSSVQLSHPHMSLQPWPLGEWWIFISACGDPFYFCGLSCHVCSFTLLIWVFCFSSQCA